MDNKNLKNILRLAGLLKEQDEMGGDPMAGGDAAGPGGAPAGGDDPSAMIDQAIELLNKVKEALGGGGGQEAGAGAEGAGQTAPPQGI